MPLLLMVVPLAAGPNLRAIMLNCNSPETRGVALALQSVTDDLGKGLGPVVVAGRHKGVAPTTKKLPAILLLA